MSQRNATSESLLFIPMYLVFQINSLRGSMEKENFKSYSHSCIYDAGLKLMKTRVISKTALYSWSDLYNFAILRPEPFQTPDNGASCYSRPLA